MIMLLQWRVIGKRWFLVLTRFSQALYANQQFTIDEMHNYRMAVTEREVASLIGILILRQMSRMDTASTLITRLSTGAYLKQTMM